jgi:hypothetical protein
MKNVKLVGANDLQHMPWKLWLDDLRDPPDDTFVVARNFEAATSTIKKKGCPLFISFDHDLGEVSDGETAPTGYDLAKWIVEMHLEGVITFSEGFSFRVHSANPIGAANISSLLDEYLSFIAARKENDK